MKIGIDVTKWTTNRLIIERSNNEDFEKLAPMLLDRNVTEYIDLFPIQFRSVGDCKKFLEKDVEENNLMFTIRIKTTNEIIGQLGYYAYDGNMSVIYWIGSKYQNNGYATEAAIDLSSHVFSESHFNSFAIYFHLAHAAAVKSALKVKNGLLEKHSEWSSIYKERDVQKYVVSNIDEEKVTIKRLSPEPLENGSQSNEFKQDKISFPDELLSIGTKFELKCGFYIISKNKT